MLLVSVGIVLLVGCGSSGRNVRVTGQLVKDGKSYAANMSGKEPDTFAVDFVGTIDGNGFVFPATVSADGAFHVDGAEGSGIPRGEYKIAVLHSGYLGAGGDRFGARFAAEKTPLTVNVQQNTHLTIDVGTGSVTQ